MTLKQALKRIEELERRVKELEARPQTIVHYHYTTPAYVPVPYQPTYTPTPWWWGSTTAGTSFVAGDDVQYSLT